MLRVDEARIAVPAARGSALLTRNFALVTIANFALFASMQGLVPTLPLYVEQLGGTDALVGLVGGVFVLAAVAVRPWVGGLLDERGRKEVLIASFVVFAVAGLLYPLAGSIAALIMVRSLQGIGWGGAIPAAGTIVADVVPAKRRGEGLGYFGLSSNLAMAVAPAAGLALVRLFGFTPLFVGAAVCAAVAATLVLPVSEIPRVARAGAAQTRTLFEPTTVAPSLVAGMLTFTMGGLTTFIAIDAAERPVGDPAVFFLVYATVLLVTRPVAGWISDQRGRGSVLVPSVAIAAAGLLVLGATANAWTLPITALLYGLGFGAAQPALQALVVDRASPARHGAAMAGYYIAFDLGVGLGTVLFGVAAGAIGLPITFEIAAGIVLAALVVAARSGLGRPTTAS